MRCRNPMNHAFHPPAVGRLSAGRLRIVRAPELRHAAFRVADHLVAPDQIGIAQANLAARRQAIVFFRRILHEIAPLDPYLAAERHPAASGRLVLGIIDAFDGFLLVLGIVRDDYFQRIEHRHAPFGALVQVLAHAELEQPQIDHVVALGYAHLVGEHTNALGGIAPTAERADRRHPGIVPARHDTFLHQLKQLALAHHRIGQIQPRELVLVARKNPEFLDKPVV